MKKKISGSRIAERILRNNMMPELDAPKLIFSETLFSEALGKSDLLKKVVARVAETFARQHPADEWAASLPLKQSYDLELAENILQDICEYMTRHLPHAYYCASLLVIYQGIFHAFGDEMPEPLLCDLEAKIGLLMRPRASELPTRNGRGAPYKWPKHRLEAAVDTAVSRITTVGALRLDKVASRINELYELDKPLSGNTLGRLLRRKEVDWLKRKAKRKKELEKRT